MELNSADLGGAGFKILITFDFLCLAYFFLSCLLLLVLLTACQVYCLSYLPPALLMSSPPSPSLVLMSHRNPMITAWEQPSLTDGSSSVGISTVPDLTLFKGDQGLNSFLLLLAPFALAVACCFLTSSHCSPILPVISNHRTTL